GGGPESRSRATSEPKPSSFWKMLPMPATRMPLPTARLLDLLDRLDLVDPEVAVPAVGHLEFGAGVVVEGDGEVRILVGVEEHGLHGGGPPGQEHVLGVGAARRRPQDDAAGAPDALPGDLHRVALRRVRGAPVGPDLRE